LLVKADLHIHSTFSDGRNSPLDIVEAALERGLSVISITDHDTFAGSIHAVRYGRSRGVLVVPGIEVRTSEGDILVYCVKEFNPPRRVDRLIEAAHREGCLVVPAHPFDVLRLGVGDLIYEYKDWDAIEVWNASSTKGANYRAIEAAKLLGKPGLANSDAHIVEEVGAAYTLIEVSELKVEEVLEAIRKGFVRPVYGRLPFKVRVERVLWSIQKSIFR
jgi:predicted metal-dependent phosphoesterase TrpH